MDLLCRKGFYPYQWVDGIEKLDYEGIPPIESFRSQVKHESVLNYDDDDDTQDYEENKIRKPSSKKIMSNFSKIMMFLFV